MEQSFTPARKLPFNHLHVFLGARMGTYSGWNVPISYLGILKEWEIIRNHVGIFDISHMGRLFVSGDKAESFLNHTTTRQIKSLNNGKLLNALILNVKAGIVDDITVYKLSDAHFFLCVNAANTARVLEHMRTMSDDFGVDIVNASKFDVQLAIQGPKSEDALVKAIKQMETIKTIPFYGFKELSLESLSTPMLVSRTGYTGEDGFEFYMHKPQAEWLLDKLFNLDEAVRPKMCGFGARDVLRLEAGYCLHGNDISEHTNPIEAGLQFAVSLNKPNFVGKKELIKQSSKGVRLKRVGLSSASSRVPRKGQWILLQDKKIGTITSGTYSPFLKKGIAMGYVGITYAKPDTSLRIGDESKRSYIQASITSLPFYKPKTKR